MSFYGSWKIDDPLTFYANTTRFDTGAATDADSAPSYRVYEDETATPLLTGSMALLDSTNTAGFYSEQITLSAANGFEKGKSYSIYIEATVNSVVGATHHNFQLEAEVDANRINWANIDNPTTAQNLSATNIDTDQVVASVTGAVGSVTGAVGSVTGNVGGNVTGSIGSLATQAKADVNAEVDTALVDIRLDELLAADSDIDGVAPPTVGSVFHELMTKTAGSFTFDQTTDSLEAIRDRGDAAWITATGFSTLDAAGVRSAVGLAAANLDTQLSTIDDFLDTEIAAIITTLGTPSDLGSGATVAANLVDIEAQTDDIGAAGAGLTAIPWNAAWDAEVQSEVDDAMVARNLDKLILASGTADSGSTTTMVDAARTEADNDYWKGRVILFTSGNIAGECAIVTDFVAATDTFTFAPALTQAVDTQNYVILPGISVWDDTLAEHLASGTTGNALNAAGSAGDPWSTALPGAYGAGSAGKIVGDNLNATVSSRATQTSVDTVDTNVDSILADTGTDGVVVAAGSKTGYTLSAAGIQAIWDALTSALTTVGSIGKLLVDNINATISSRASQTSVDTIDDFLDTEIATLITNTGNIETDTQDIQSRLPAALVTGRMDSSVGAMAANTLTASALATDAVTEIQSGLSTLTAAQVNTEVDTALADVNLDHLVGTATAIPAIPAGTYLDQMMDDGTNVFDRTTDSLQAIRDRGDAAWPTADVSALALQTSVDDLEGRLTAARAGYLDNLSAGAVATAASISALNNISTAQVNAEVVDALTVDVIADSIPADGSRPTIGQALLMVTRFLMEKSVSGTTVTVKKEDGSTSSFTLTLDSATTPTSITRAT